jgi:hypothetical protein
MTHFVGGQTHARYPYTYGVAIAVNASSVTLAFNATECVLNIQVTAPHCKILLARPTLRPVSLCATSAMKDIVDGATDQQWSVLKMMTMLIVDGCVREGESVHTCTSNCKGGTE